MPIDACCFYRIHFSISLSLTSLFLFFLFFPFQLFVLNALVALPFPFMGIVPIYTISSLRVFLFFTLIANQPFLSTTNTLQRSPGAEARYALAPPKFFRTFIIVGRNRSHTFSFKSWPPYEENLALPPVRSHKNAPPQIPTFHLFDFSFHSLRHVSHIPHFFFLE